MGLCVNGEYFLENTAKVMLFLVILENGNKPSMTLPIKPIGKKLGLEKW
jgi:hypothetical protein